MSALEYKKLASLLESAQGGDYTAFREIYDMTSKAQYYHIYQIVGDSYEAQDVLQETYLLLYQNLHKINPPSALLAYLNRLSYFASKNTAKYQARRLHRITDISQAECLTNAEDTPLHRVEASEDVRIIRKAVSELPERERLVVSMRYYQRMSLQDIADSMGISVSTVKRLNQSAKAILKHALKSEGIMSFVCFSPKLRHALMRDTLPGEMPKLADVSAKSSKLSGECPDCPHRTAGLSPQATLALKAALLTTGASCVALGAAHALPSPGFSYVRTPEEPQAAPAYIEYKASGVLGLNSTSVRGNDGKEVLVEPLSDGTYRAVIKENGDYRIILKASNGKTTEKSVQIDCIDSVPPKADGLMMEGAKVSITLRDEGSGIDFDSVYCESASGIYVRPDSVDESGRVLFSLEAESYVLHFSDNAGNYCSTPIDAEVLE